MSFLCVERTERSSKEHSNFVWGFICCRANGSTIINVFCFNCARVWQFSRETPRHGYHVGWTKQKPKKKILKQKPQVKKKEIFKSNPCRWDSILIERNFPRTITKLIKDENFTVFITAHSRWDRKQEIKIEMNMFAAYLH